jgi:TusA-related sulfurtransferase
MNLTIAKEVDTKGMACPLPILKAKRALAEVSSGELVRVVATDPASVRDFQAFAKQTGNELIEQSNTASEYIHILRRR